MIYIDSDWYNNLTRNSPPEIWQTFCGALCGALYFNFRSDNLEISVFKKTYMV